jgi:hypothetical protein
MMTNTNFLMTIIIVFLLCSVSFFSCKNVEEDNQNITNHNVEIPFHKVDSKGLIPESIPAQKVTYRDRESWEAFWQKYGKESPPKLDFTKYMIVGIFLGPMGSSGYGVKITKIQKADSSIIVNVTEYVENPNLGYLPVIIYPHYIVYFHRTEGEIIFMVEQKIVDS